MIYFCGSKPNYKLNYSRLKYIISFNGLVILMLGLDGCLYGFIIFAINCNVNSIIAIRDAN